MKTADSVWCVQIFRVSDPEVAELVVARLSHELGDAVTAMSTGGRRDSSVAVETMADADLVTVVQTVLADLDPSSELVHLSTADPWHVDEDAHSAAA